MWWVNRSIEIREVISGMKPADGQAIENRAFQLRILFVRSIQKLKESMRNVVRLDEELLASRVGLCSAELKGKAIPLQAWTDP